MEYITFFISLFSFAISAIALAHAKYSEEISRRTEERYRYDKQKEKELKERDAADFTESEDFPENTIFLTGDSISPELGITEKGLALIAAIECGAIPCRNDVYDTSEFNRVWEKFETLRLENGHKKAGDSNKGAGNGNPKSDV